MRAKVSFSSFFSGEPGAYDLTGSLTGAGTLKNPCAILVVVFFLIGYGTCFLCFCLLVSGPATTILKKMAGFFFKNTFKITPQQAKKLPTGSLYGLIFFNKLIIRFQELK
jgi:hypothetical protein